METETPVHGTGAAAVITSIQESTTLEVSKKVAGRLTYFVNKWSNVTTNRTILSWIQGLKIPFVKKPVQGYVAKERKWSNSDMTNVKSSIDKLLEGGLLAE